MTKKVEAQNNKNAEKQLSTSVNKPSTVGKMATKVEAQNNKNAEKQLSTSVNEDEDEDTFKQDIIVQKEKMEEDEEQIQHKVDTHEITFRNATRLNPSNDANTTVTYDNSNSSSEHQQTFQKDENNKNSTQVKQQQQQQQKQQHQLNLNDSILQKNQFQNGEDFSSKNNSSTSATTKLDYTNQDNNQTTHTTSLNQTDLIGFSPPNNGLQKTNKIRPKGFAVRPPEKAEPTKEKPQPPKNEATLTQNETNLLTEGLINHLFNFQVATPNVSQDEKIQQQHTQDKTASPGKKPPKKGFYFPSNYKDEDAATTANNNKTDSNKNVNQQKITNQNDTTIQKVTTKEKEKLQRPQKTPKILYVPVAVMAKFNEKKPSNGKNAFPIHESKLLKHVSSFHHQNKKNKNGIRAGKNKRKAEGKKKKHVKKYSKNRHHSKKKKKPYNTMKVRQEHRIKKHRNNKWRRAHRKTQVNGQMEHQTRIFNQNHRHPMEGHRYGGETYQHTHKMASHDFTEQTGHYGVHDDDSDSHSNTDRFAEMSPNATESNQRQTLGGVNKETPTLKLLGNDRKPTTILGQNRKVDDTTIVNKINQFTSLAKHLAENLSNFNRGKGWKPKQDPDWKSFLQSREHLKDIEVGKK